MPEQWARESLRHFAQVDGYTVALCDIKQEWAEGGKDKIAKKVMQDLYRKEK